MFIKNFVDYTTMPVGKATRRGRVSLCERCGKPGLYIKFIIPPGTIEKWIHSEHYNIFMHQEPDTSCVYTVLIAGNETKSGWGGQASSGGK